MTTESDVLNRSEAGASNPTSLNRRLVQRMALRAVGQRAPLVLPPKPGDLVDPDGAADDALGFARKPLVAAPRPAFEGVVAATVAARTALPVVLGAAPDAGSLAEPLAAETACQPTVDLKAFTGRGEPRSVRLAAKAVDDIHARMRELALASMKVGKNVLYLTVHARSLTNQHSLRWRGYSLVGGKGRHTHLTWDEAAQRIRSYPYAVLAQLQVWDAEARELNDLERAARAEYRLLRSNHESPAGTTS
jgi:hypothetical protein